MDFERSTIKQTPASPATLVWFGLVYLAGCWLSARFLRSPEDVAMIWIPSGVAYAGAIFYGWRVAIPIAVATILMHSTFAPVPWPFVLFSILANGLPPLAGAWVAVRLTEDGLPKLRVRDGFALFAGGVVQVLTSSLIGGTGLIANGMVSADAPFAAYGGWAVGNLFGVLSLSATLLVLHSRLDEQIGYVPEPRRNESLLWAVCLGLSLVIVILAARYSGAQALGLASLPTAVLLWAALRLPPRIAFVGSSLTALLIATVTGLGFAGFSLPEGPLESAVLVGSLCVAVAVPQVLAAATHENRIGNLRLLHRATHDPLTGLGNRLAFEERVRDLLRDKDRLGWTVGYLDIDQFSIVNDALSHRTGDAVLSELAGVLRSLLGSRSIYRIGGDEFGLLLAPDEEESDRLGHILHRLATHRIQSGDAVVSVTASIGYAQVDRFRTHAAGSVFDDLFAAIDAACLAAKEHGGGRALEASPDEGRAAEQTQAMRWVVRLKEAIAESRIELFCQPVVALQKSATAADNHVEVLLRLRDKDSGALLPPGEVIAAAERFGLATRLDQHVIEKVFAWLQRHPDAVARLNCCAVNLSASSLVDETFSRWLLGTLQRSPIPPKTFCFEITETAAVRDIGRAAHFVRALRAAGCRIAIDDFGSGYSSFAYLAQLEADILKIDGSFVKAAAHSPVARVVVESIVAIAHETGRLSVAECVEDAETAEQMRAFGVDLGQGWAFGYPAPLDEILLSGDFQPADIGTG